MMITSSGKLNGLGSGDLVKKAPDLKWPPVGIFTGDLSARFWGILGLDLLVWEGNWFEELCD